MLFLCHNASQAYRRIEREILVVIHIVNVSVGDVQRDAMVLDALHGRLHVVEVLVAVSTDLQRSA